MAVLSRDGTLSQGMSVKEVMDSWTLQTGFPVITVTRDYQDNTATLIQVSYEYSSYYSDQGLYQDTTLTQVSYSSYYSLQGLPGHNPHTGQI